MNPYRTAQGQFASKEQAGSPVIRLATRLTYLEKLRQRMTTWRLSARRQGLTQVWAEDLEALVDRVVTEHMRGNR